MDQSDGFTIEVYIHVIVESDAKYIITTSSIILTVLIVLIPVWLYLSYKNSATKSVTILRLVLCHLCHGHQQVREQAYIVSRIPPLDVNVHTH